MTLAKHQEVTEIAPNAGPDALIKHKIKKQRHREGYADGISTTHRAISAAAFVMSDHPVEVLGNNTRCGADATCGPADWLLLTTTLAAVDLLLTTTLAAVDLLLTTTLAAVDHHIGCC